MALTTQQLDSFHRFAREQLDAGEAGLSLEKLASRWLAAQQQADTDNAIHEAIDQMNVGLGESLDDAMEDIRRRLDLPAE
jgi:predicted ATPase